MHYPPERRVEIYARAMQGLLSLETDGNRQRKYVDFIDGYADLNEEEVARYRAEYLEKTGEHTMGLVATIREEGIQQGLRQGVRKGESLLLRRQLSRRYGALPAWAEARLAEAEPEQLELWGERILDPEAGTLEAIFKDE